MHAQNILKTGLLGEVKIKIALPNDWELENKFQNRQILLESTSDKELTYGYKYERTDIGTLLLKKYGTTKVGLGYLLRLSESQKIHRFSQLYIVKKKYAMGEMNHRFLADQTFVPTEPTLFRFRYRIGLTTFFHTNDGEKRNFFYAKFNQESLLKLAFPNTANLEFRLLPILGLAFQKNQSIELGLEYRISFFGKKLPPHGQYWLYLGYGINLK